MSFQTPGMSVVAEHGLREDTNDILLAEGSSARPLPRDTESWFIVLADPPSCEVQFAELAGVFSRGHGRASCCRLTELDLGAEAVANRIRRIVAEEYRDLLGAILTETRRTLKPTDSVLTYHNTGLRAWWALGSALRDAASAPAPSPLPKPRASGIMQSAAGWASQSDLVLECRPTAATGEAGSFGMSTTSPRRTSWWREGRWPACRSGRPRRISAALSRS